MGTTRREFIKATAASAAAAAIGVDLMLSESLMAQSDGTWHKSVCRYCGVGCGMMVQTRDGKIVGLRGDKENTINGGLLCVKGFYLQKVITAENRLKRPLIRKNGKLQEASWKEAMDLVATRFRESIDQNGPDSVAFYGSGQAETEETYIANKLFKGHIGTNNFEGNPRLCMASAVGGYVTTFGLDEPVGSYDDMDNADMFFMVGSNTAEAHPVLFDRIVRRRRENPNLKIVIVDPRQTPTDRVADMTLQCIPGYDMAILHAMAKIIIDEGYADEEFINDTVNFSDGSKAISYDQYKQFLSTFTPEHAAERSGTKAEDIIKAARMFGETEKVMSMWTMGVNQRVRGVWMNNLIHNLHLLTGKLGYAGADSFSLTGQPNACGGVREGGGLAHLLPGHRLVANEQHRQEIAKIWNVPASNIAPKPGLHTMALFEAITKGDIKALYVMCTNPAQSLPNLNDYLQGMEDTFMVVAESFHPTETSKIADVVLPAAFWGEKEGVYGCTERRSQYMPKLVEPQGEARWDAQILIDLAKRMGYADGFDHYTSAEDIWSEYIITTAGRDMDLSGAPYSRLKEVRGLRWPVPTVDHPGTTHRFVKGDPLFPEEKARGRRMYFYGKPEGKAIIFARPDKGPEEPTDEQYPIALTTGRVLELWHTNTMTGQVPQLNRAVPVPYMEMNPDDASKMDISDRERVRVVTRRDSLEMICRVSERPRPGTIFIPWHWPESLTNLLTTDAIDPGSKEPEYKVCASRIEKV